MNPEKARCCRLGPELWGLGHQEGACWGAPCSVPAFSIAGRAKQMLSAFSFHKSAVVFDVLAQTGRSGGKSEGALVPRPSMAIAGWGVYMLDG